MYQNHRRAGEKEDEMPHITDRFYNSRWGVFTHYLGHGATTAEEYNATVNSFDVKKVAKALHDVGAGYYFITIMQGKRFMLAPNETYNKITGYKPGEACAERDLIAELIAELDKYGIDLYLYYTGDGPHYDRQAGEAMGFCDIDNPLWDKNGVVNPTPEQVSIDYIKNWTSVLEEYAVRYGKGVKGWWFDGMYAWFGYNEEKCDYFRRAVKKGNPDAIVAFNNGVKRNNEHNWCAGDFIAGEANDFIYEHVLRGRFFEGGQNHKLVMLGFNKDNPRVAGWGKKGLQISKEYLKTYVNKAHEEGTVVTLEIAIERDGSFDPEQVDALKHINT